MEECNLYVSDQLYFFFGMKLCYCFRIFTIYLSILPITFSRIFFCEIRWLYPSIIPAILIIIFILKKFVLIYLFCRLFCYISLNFLLSRTTAKLSKSFNASVGISSGPTVFPFFIFSTAVHTFFLLIRSIAIILSSFYLVFSLFYFHCS